MTQPKLPGACSATVARLVCNEEVTGSNPVKSINPNSTEANCYKNRHGSDSDTACFSVNSFLRNNDLGKRPALILIGISGALILLSASRLGIVVTLPEALLFYLAGDEKIDTKNKITLLIAGFLMGLFMIGLLEALIIVHI
jgi:hypothetical protein